MSFPLWLKTSLSAFIVSLDFSSVVLANGGSLYEEHCVACHGEDGMGNEDLRSPAIAGLTEAYLLRQTLNFKTKIRGGTSPDDAQEMMIDAVSELSEDDMKTISQHVASLAIQQIEQEVPSAGFRGRGLYSSCLSCHGAQGEGYPDLHAPRLAQQHGWYLEKQIKDFMSGQRGMHETDELGQQMREMALGIQSEADVETLVRHIVKLRGE